VYTDRIPVIFFRTKAGAEPVREWLRELSKEDRHTVGTDLKRVQEQWPVGMPVCRSVGNGLWEVRSNLTGNRIARLIFFFDDDVVVVLHGFVKKTRKTSASDVELARKRMKEVKR
jgi:phage-related protein